MARMDNGRPLTTKPVVNAMTAKAIAMARGIPYLAVNHLEAHALTARLTDKVAFPYLLLLVSGGHNMLVQP